MVASQLLNDEAKLPGGGTVSHECVQLLVVVPDVTKIDNFEGAPLRMISNTKLVEFFGATMVLVDIVLIF